MPTKEKIGKSEYEFLDLKASDYFKLKDLNSTAGADDGLALDQLISKGVKRDGSPIEIQEVDSLDGRVAHKFVASLGIADLIPLDGLGGLGVGKGEQITEQFELNGRKFAHNEDYSTGDYKAFLATQPKKPGTALKGLICSYLTLSGKKMTDKDVDNLTYGEAIALQQYLSLVFA